MMKFLSLIFFSGFWLLTAFFPAQDPENDPLPGYWCDEDNNVALQIYREDGAYFGKIVDLKKPQRNGKPRCDYKNPDPTQRNIPLMGLLVLRDFQRADENTYKKGELYNPDSGNTYKGRIEVKGPNEIKVRGYVGFSLFGKSRTFYRTSKEAPLGDEEKE